MATRRHHRGWRLRLRYAAYLAAAIAGAWPIPAVRAEAELSPPLPAAGVRAETPDLKTRGVEGGAPVALPVDRALSPDGEVIRLLPDLERAAPSPTIVPAEPRATAVPTQPVEQRPAAATAPMPLAPTSPEAARLEARIEELRTTIADQQREIERLRDTRTEDLVTETWKRISAGWIRLRALGGEALAYLDTLVIELGPRNVAPALATALLLGLMAAMFGRRKTQEARQMKRILALAAPVRPVAASPGDAPVVAPDFLAKVMESFDPGLRRRWALKMSAKPDAPRDLIAAFAADSFAIAEPVLKASPVLQEPMLLDLVQRLGSQYQRAIAQRRGLSPALAAALVQTDKIEVITALLRNRSARIAEETMRRIVDAARIIESYREPLARRPDLSPQLAWRLYDWVDESLRATLRAKFESSHIEAAVTAAAEAEDAKAEQTPAAEAAPIEAAGPAAAEVPTPQRLADPLRAGDLDRFLSMLAEITGLSIDRVRPMLEAHAGGELAVLCRALDLEPSRFAWIYLRLRRLQGTRPDMEPGELARAVAAHAETSAATARATLSDWQRQGAAAE